MLTRTFEYDLPSDLIAQEALPRGESRLLVVEGAADPRDSTTRSLPSLLSKGDLIVVNNTRVLAARLFGSKSTGATVEILLAEERSALDWICLARPGRRARPGSRIEFSSDLSATVVRKLADGRHLLRFSRSPLKDLDAIGHVPLPPYIKREDSKQDRERYQTVYARVPGAIAAPTAGLHFDQDLLSALEQCGVGVVQLTLHVGLGTFKPVTSELVHEHRMESERFVVAPECASAIAETRRQGGRIVAVGTTVVRTLEGLAAEHGGRVPAAEGATDLFIVPGFDFRIVDVLLTNFHLPRSTLLMLVCAFGGTERTLAAYREAVNRRYRFYSYGDAMLLGPDPSRIAAS